MRTHKNRVLAKPAGMDALADLDPWEERWEQLSDKARGEYIRLLPQLVRSPNYYSYYGTRIEERALEQLRLAGFIEQSAVPRNRLPYAIPSDARAFAEKLNSLKGLARLTNELRYWRPGCLLPARMSSEQHVKLLQLAKKLPCATGKGDLALSQLVPYSRWHDLVLDDLNRNPVAARLIELFRERNEPMPKVAVSRLLPEWPASIVRNMLDSLICRLALFEDLDARTSRLIVGMPKVVRDHWRIWKAWPAKRPALVAAPRPTQVGPAAGFLVADLRATLIELLRLPARLKANGDIYAKEMPRFESVLTPLPDWLTGQLHLDSQERFSIAYFRLGNLHFAEPVYRDAVAEMQSTQVGRDWLAKSADEQYAAVAKLFMEWDVPGNDYFRPFAESDSTAGEAYSLPLIKGRTPSNPWNPKSEELAPMRRSFARCFDQLPVGEFYPLTNFLAHACHDKNNPLRLGLEDHEFIVFSNEQPVTPFPEILDRLAANTLKKLILERLIPFGGVQAGWDGRRLLIARQPLCDLYFGRPSATKRLLLAADAGKVIVQPDFSILVIGENPASAAELASFCERKPGPASHGTLQFVLTKTSVVRAAMAGTSAQEILARLERHSSVPIPGNVRHEIVEWAGTVCPVDVVFRFLIRCPDGSAAVRVAGLLGKCAERVGETVVAVPLASWNASAKRKLREAGIVLPTDPDQPQRRYRY